MQVSTVSPVRTTRARAVAALLVLLAPALAAALALGTAPATAAAAAEPVVIALTGAGPDPASVTVAPATPLRFVNRDVIVRGVRADGRGWQFSSGLLAPGASYDVPGGAPRTAGTYRYTGSGPLDDFAGAVVVRAVATAAPAPTRTAASPRPPRPGPRPTATPTRSTAPDRGTGDADAGDAADEPSDPPSAIAAPPPGGAGTAGVPGLPGVPPSGLPTGGPALPTLPPAALDATGVAEAAASAAASANQVPIAGRAVPGAPSRRAAGLPVALAVLALAGVLSGLWRALLAEPTGAHARTPTRGAGGAGRARTA